MGQVNTPIDEGRATCVIQTPSQGSVRTSVCARSGWGVGLMRSMAELPITFMVSANACAAPMFDKSTMTSVS